MAQKENKGWSTICHLFLTTSNSLTKERFHSHYLSLLFVGIMLHVYLISGRRHL